MQSQLLRKHMQATQTPSCCCTQVIEDLFRYQYQFSPQHKPARVLRCPCCFEILNSRCTRFLADCSAVAVASFKVTMANCTCHCASKRINARPCADHSSCTKRLHKLPVLPAKPVLICQLCTNRLRKTSPASLPHLAGLLRAGSHAAQLSACRCRRCTSQCVGTDHGHRSRCLKPVDLHTAICLACAVSSRLTV